MAQSQVLKHIKFVRKSSKHYSTNKRCIEMSFKNALKTCRVSPMPGLLLGAATSK
jgi:hypothetical protein